MALRPDNSQTDEDKKQQKKDAQDDVLMREVDDAVRQDQYADFAKSYGRPLLALVVVGLMGFGGYLWWDAQEEARMETQSERLVSALDQVEQANLDSSSKALGDLATEGKGGAAVQAQLLVGGIALEQGKNAAAAQAFAKVAADAEAPQAIRDLATVREVAATYDEREPDEVIGKLKTLAVPGNPYFGSAGEMVAHAYLQQGKRKEAGVLFGEIAKDEDVPESMRSRARQMAGLLGVDSIEDVDELMDELTVPSEAPEGAAPPPAQ